MRKIMVFAAACALVATGWGSASAAPGGNGRFSIARSHPSWAVAAARVAGVNAGTGIDIRVYLKGANDAGLEAVARAVSDPKSASYRHFLTPAAVRAGFAPTATTVSLVRNWLQSQGLQLLGQPANNLYVEAAGSATQIASAFGVQLGTYNVRGIQLRAPDRDLTVPT
jgi:subtilase family serine protease